MSDLVKKINHSGFEYEVDKICNLIDEGVEPKDALRTLYPTLPAKSVQPILAKVKKSPYYLARKDLKMNILEAKGPELQNNLLDLAMGARSEMVRFNATDSALDRIYGKKDAEVQDKPQFVFNFSFKETGSDGRVPDRVIIDSEVKE